MSPTVRRRIRGSRATYRGRCQGCDRHRPLKHGECQDCRHADRRPRSQRHTRDQQEDTDT